MSTPAIITAIICTALVLVVALAVFATPTGGHRRQCYFADVHAELGAPGGRLIGGQPCSGSAEYTYAVTETHPAYVLQGVKVCPAHVGSLSELTAVIGDITGYWLVPDA